MVAGFANRAFPADDLDAEVLAIAERVAKVPPDPYFPREFGRMLRPRLPKRLRGAIRARLPATLRP
mgnify:CR=1 FL=1